MKVILTILIIFLLIFSFSCEFKPSDIPETYVEQPDENAPVLYIEVQPGMDTLKLATDVWTEFKFTSPETEVKWVTITFDDNVVYDSEYSMQNRPRFYIALGSYTEGLHYFTIQAFASSNTGSIADMAGAEGYLYEVQWPVIIHQNIERRLHVKSVEYKKGGTQVTWEKYDYSDFEYYRLIKTSSTSANEAEYHITNPQITTLFDTTYLEGEYSDYQVSLNGEYGHSYSFQKPVQTPEIILNEEKNRMMVRWNRTQNPKRLGYYHVALKVPDTYFYQEVMNEDAEDTVAVYNISPGFGDNYEFQVRYVPAGFDQPYVIYNSSGGKAIFSLGNQMLSFENAMKIGDTGDILLYNDGLFYKYNIVSHTVLDSFRVEDLANPVFIRVSPSGQFFSYFTNTDFVMRKTSDWGLVGQFTTPLTNYGTVLFWNVSISDNYRLLVTQHLNVLSITDVRTGDELFRKTGAQGENFADAVINSEGDKILYNTYVYDDEKNYLHLVDFDGAKFTELGETTAASPGANYGIVQYAILEDKVLILKSISGYDYRWEERSVSDFSLINGFDLPHSFVPVAIDFPKKQLITRYGLNGGFDESYSLFYDFENNTSHKITPIIKGQRFVLSNDVLANGSGRYLSLSDLIQE
jgi:hypothetical protein